MDNKKNVVSPFFKYPLFFSISKRKVKIITEKQFKNYCLLSRQQNFGDNFSVVRLVIVLGYEMLVSQNHLVKFGKKSGQFTVKLALSSHLN